MFPSLTILITDCTHSKDTLLQIANDNHGKEILGQILDPVNPYKGELQSERVSHTVKAIQYNHLINGLTAEVECLPTVYGLQLAKIMSNNIDSIVLHPVYCRDKFITVNIEIIHEEA